MVGRGVCRQCHLQTEASRTCWKNPARKKWSGLGWATKALVKSIEERAKEAGGGGSGKKREIQVLGEANASKASGQSGRTFSPGQWGGVTVFAELPHTEQNNCLGTWKWLGNESRIWLSTKVTYKTTTTLRPDIILWSVAEKRVLTVESTVHGKKASWKHTKVRSCGMPILWQNTKR